MTKNEHLWLKLVEECAEVQQRVLKLLQFGPGEIQAGQPFNNLERMLEEIKDLLSVLAMLNDRGDIPQFSEEEQISAYLTKKDKIAKYLALSISLNRVIA